MNKPSNAMVKLAANRLGMDEETTRSLAVPARGLDGAFFFSRGTRGGGRLLVSADLKTLFAASGVTPEEQVAAFKCGRRS